MEIARRDTYQRVYHENGTYTKSLLRQSMSATVLTHTERTFLNSLLALEGDVADLLCKEAHGKLSANNGAFDTAAHDKALGVFGLCGLKYKIQ
jgi:hypothetical protein